MKPSLGAVIALLLSAAITYDAEVSPSKDAIDYQQPPTPKFESGLVRVWNAKGGPPDGEGHVPEAKLGDALVVELKNIDQWLCQNLDAGAWLTDSDVVGADPLVGKILEARKLWPAVRAGRWLEMMKNADDSPDAGKEGPAADAKNIQLLADLKTRIQLDNSLLPARDEKGASLDPTKSKDASLIVKACLDALGFVREFRKHKAAQFILTINNIALRGLPVKTQESRVNWRSASDRMEEGAYTWWQIKLQALDDPESEKAWSDLMRATAPHFSLSSNVTLFLPGELIALPTGVTETAADSRCRFDLIAISQAPRAEKKLTTGEAVYPLDVRERSNEIRRGEIVEIDSHNPATPYVVHFSEKGGTKNYRSLDLARLPPDPVPLGVVRVWNAKVRSSEWEEAQKNEVPTAKIGDRLLVEVRNFDGWLCNQIDQGFLHDDPLLQKASKTLDSLIKAKGFSDAVKVGGAVRRISYGKQKTSADIVRQLQKDAAANADLAALSFPSLHPPQIRKLGALEKSPLPPSSETPKLEEESARKEDEQKAQTFLAPYREAHSLLRELVKGKLRALNLTINDLALGITPDNADFTPIDESRRPAENPGEDTYHWLRFTLAPKPGPVVKEEEKATDDPFKRLMAKPAFTMPSKVTLTLKSGADTLTLPTAVTQEAKDQRCQFDLIGIEQWMFWLMVIVFGLIFVSLCFFAAKTDILRDPCRRRPEGVEPVSLARTQMAFWFVLIAAAFLFLWVTTGNVATINGTCLVLLAIGTTTALSSAAIQGNRDRRKDLSDVLRRTPYEMLKMTPLEMRAAIEARKKELEESAPGSITSEERAQENEILKRHEEEIDCFLKKQPSWLPAPVYFWRYRLRTIFEDLLTEEASTYDFHRFQILAWTLVLGSVFVVKVFNERVMPVFDTNVLLLMGISSGAYLGFKKAATNRADEEKKIEEKKDADLAGPKPTAG